MGQDHVRCSWDCRGREQLLLRFPEVSPFLYQENSCCFDFQRLVLSLPRQNKNPRGTDTCVAMTQFPLCLAADPSVFFFVENAKEGELRWWLTWAVCSTGQRCSEENAYIWRCHFFLILQERIHNLSYPFSLLNCFWQCPLMFLLLLLLLLLFLVIFLVSAAKKPPSDQDSNYDEIGIQHYS